MVLMSLQFETRLGGRGGRLVSRANSVSSPTIPSGIILIFLRRGNHCSYDNVSVRITNKVFVERQKAFVFRRFFIHREIDSNMKQ